MTTEPAPEARAGLQLADGDALLAERALREAMAAGPTPGIWFIRSGHGASFIQAPRLRKTDPYDVELLGEDDSIYPTRDADLAYVVAAQPVNITALLSAKDAMAAELAALREANRRLNDEMSTWVRRGDKTWHEKLWTDQIAALREEVAGLRGLNDKAAQKPLSEWQPIETAPDSELVVVGWLEDEDSENPERYGFDYKEDDCWLKHAEDVEYADMVAPRGSRMPKQQAPYTYWLALPEIRPKAGRGITEPPHTPADGGKDIPL